MEQKHVLIVELLSIIRKGSKQPERLKVTHITLLGYLYFHIIGSVHLFF